HLSDGGKRSEAARELLLLLDRGLLEGSLYRLAPVWQFDEGSAKHARHRSAMFVTGRQGQFEVALANRGVDPRHKLSAIGSFVAKFQETQEEDVDRVQRNEDDGDKYGPTTCQHVHR